ncbi:MAG: hypothetical protein M4579_003346 [Chaenotheca gracillima]|nr:MAG: hypothetical protein M4579_003346 [Chaenotheca gracillima]
MSGRSAFVRKEKAKVKDKKPDAFFDGRPLDNFFEQDLPLSADQSSRPNSKNGSKAESMAYSSSSQETKTRVSSLYGYESSGIERSSFRIFMDGKSDAFRNKLSTTFGGKGTSATENGEKDKQLPTYGPVPTVITLDGVQKPMLPAHNALSAPSSRMNDGTGQSETSREVSHPRPNSGKQNYLKMYMGHGQPPQVWEKKHLGKDVELFDREGDTEIFFNTFSRHERLHPSYRIQSFKLEEAKTDILAALISEGQNHLNRLNKSHGFSRSVYSPYDQGFDTLDSPQEGSPTAAFSTTDFISPFHYPQLNQKAPPTIKSLSRMPSHPTTSSAPSESGSSERDLSPANRVYLPARPYENELENLRYRLGVRNIIAVMLDKPLVGMNLNQIFVDLLERLAPFYNNDAEVSKLLIGYLTRYHMNDVRNDPQSALSILAFCEKKQVGWVEGWREAFVHCVGMHERIYYFGEMSDIQDSTRKLVDYNHLELEVRVHTAQDMLQSFDLSSMWSVDCAQSPRIKASFEDFRRFLIAHYKTVMGTWPPPPRSKNGQTWLTREIVTKLQHDLGSLYDYLVDRDMIWDESEGRAERKWKIISESGSKRPEFDADDADVGITDVFVGFDNKQRFPHIPHPFPLLPSSVQPPAPQKASRFSSKKAKLPNASKDFERRAALAYADATNLFLLGADFVANDLVEAFSKYENETVENLGDIDPYVARKGRWILLYGLLQVVATVSVDTPGMCFTEGVQYFLNPCLEGTVPWLNQSKTKLPAAKHQMSYCWKAPVKWRSQLFSGSHSSGSPIDTSLFARGSPEVPQIAAPQPPQRSNRQAVIMPQDRGNQAWSPELGRERIPGPFQGTIPRNPVSRSQVRQSDGNADEHTSYAPPPLRKMASRTHLRGSEGSPEDTTSIGSTNFPSRNAGNHTPLRGSNESFHDMSNSQHLKKIPSATQVRARDDSLNGGSSGRPSLHHYGSHAPLPGSDEHISDGLSGSPLRKVGSRTAMRGNDEYGGEAFNHFRKIGSRPQMYDSDKYSHSGLPPRGSANRTPLRSSDESDNSTNGRVLLDYNNRTPARDSNESESVGPTSPIAINQYSRQRARQWINSSGGVRVDYHMETDEEGSGSRGSERDKLSAWAREESEYAPPRSRSNSRSPKHRQHLRQREGLPYPPQDFHYAGHELHYPSHQFTDQSKKMVNEECW